MPSAVDAVLVIIKVLITISSTTVFSGIPAPKIKFPISIPEVSAIEITLVLFVVVPDTVAFVIPANDVFGEYLISIFFVDLIFTYPEDAKLLPSAVPPPARIELSKNILKSPFAD